MKKEVCLALCVGLASVTVSAREFHVAKTGRDDGPGTRNAPFQTSQHAADVAQLGDVVSAHEGRVPGPFDTINRGRNRLTLHGPAAKPPKKKHEKPNIVLFISDDHGYADSGAYGDKVVRTPHTPWVENERYDPDAIILPPAFVDTPETRADRAKYYSDVTLMDHILGEVRKALEERDLMDSSLFVYTTDQGANWPFAKWNVYDAGLRVPFIIRWPGMVTPGSETEAMISLVDLLPTCMEAAGGAAGEDMDGRSFMGVLTGTTEQHRKVVFGAHTGNDNGGPNAANHSPARMVRTKRFQYILNLEPGATFKTHITGSPPSSIHYLPFWKTWEEAAETNEHAQRIVDKYRHRPLEELYDLDKDPHEMNNLIDHPEYQDVVRSLKRQLADWRESQGDTVPVNEKYTYQTD